jgi:shikimate dehydrogenase
MISGKTKVCGVIGDPIDHTLSPIMMNSAFSQLSLDYVYLAFRVKSVEVENAIKGLRAFGIRGVNVTMPHKSEVIKYLDEVDPTAKFLDSVNTILNVKGKLSGYSTDGQGAMEALRKNNVKLHGKKMLLLGGGGAAKAIAYAASKEVETLTVLNRTPEKAKALANVLNVEFDKKIAGDSLSPRIIEEKLHDTDILVNATSVGMHPKGNRSLVASKWLKPKLIVMDIVYNPLETRLSREAKVAGAQVVSGVDMLVYQGAASFEIWTGRKAPVETMKKAILNKLSISGVKN